MLFLLIARHIAIIVPQPRTVFRIVFMPRSDSLGIELDLLPSIQATNTLEGDPAIPDEHRGDSRCQRKPISQAVPDFQGCSARGETLAGGPKRQDDMLWRAATFLAR